MDAQWERWTQQTIEGQNVPPWFYPPIIVPSRRSTRTRERHRALPPIAQKLRGFGALTSLGVPDVSQRSPAEPSTQGATGNPLGRGDRGVLPLH